MTDIWRICKLAGAAVISFIWGLHAVIQLLLYGMAIDIATGVIAGWVEGRISSDVSRRGIGRKVLILLGVAAAEIASRHVDIEISVPWGGSWSLGAAVAGYYCIHEAISIVENMHRAGVPLPPFVTDRLEQLRQVADESEVSHVQRPH